MDKPKETSSLLLLGGAALLIAVAHNILFFGEGLGVNYVLLVALVLVGGWLLTRTYKRVADRKSVLLIFTALFFASMIFVRSSELLTFFNILGSALLLLILASSYVGKSLESYLPGDFLKVAFLPFRFIPAFFQTLPEIFGLRKIGRHHPVVRQVVRGTLMAIGALVIFVALFSSADLVFKKFVVSLLPFKFAVIPGLINRSIVLAIVSAFFIGAFGFMFRSRESGDIGISVPKIRNFGAIEMSILFSSINLLFLGFIVLQLSHLFGGESHIVSLGLTYAEYARRGFFELVLVAIFSYLIISTVEKQIIKKEAASHLGLFKVHSTILVVEVVVILVSAFYRLSLYEQAYGFTTIRLYSHALMIWLGVLSILLSHHILGGGTREKFSLRSLYCIILLLFVMNVINPDAFIAKKNLERYDKTGEIDMPYLAGLSDDAIPYSVRMLDDPNEDTRKWFARNLYWSRDFAGGNDTSWQSYRLSRDRAQKLLVPHTGFLEENKDYMSLETKSSI